MESKGQVKVVPPDGGTWLPWLGAPLQYQVLGEDSDHTYAFSRTHIPVGGGPPPHRHTFEEGLYVLRGALTFTAGDQTFAVPAGGFIHVGGGTAHFFHNTGDTEAELLLVAAPAGVDAFHRETSGGDLDRIRAAAPKYGIDLDLPADAFRRPPRVTLRLPGAGRSLAVVGDVYTFLAVGDETDGKYALWDAIVHPGGGPPPHRHRREEEGFYVLEGSVTFFADGQQVVAAPGTFLHLPRGSLHAFKNEGNTPARMLILVAPAGLEKLFEAAGRPWPDPHTPPPVTPQEIERLLAVAPQFGLEIHVPGR